jgi:hypothetical protein
VRKLSFVASLVVVALWASVAQAYPVRTLTPVKVLGGSGNQFSPWSDGTYLAYTQSAGGFSGQWIAKVTRLSGGTGVRINAPRTEGISGGFDPSTGKVVFQQFNRKKHVSDLYFWDPSTKRRTKVPGVDTSAWEFDPRISATYISFFRPFKKNGVWYDGVYLYGRSTGNVRRIAAFKEGPFAYNGAVGDRYATWSWCNKTSCSVFVYDAQNRTVRKVPTKNGRPQYASTIDEVSGNLFFVRSGFGCGKEVTFLSLPLTDLRATPTKIASLPAGVDADNWASLAPASAGGLDLLFGRVSCASATTDIYALRGVTPP